MLESLLLLLAALVLVFLAAQIFTNALEFLGEKLGVSEGVTGSIFAAVGTAMPETIVPLVAILAGGASMEVNHAVGLGAILGAPFMLGTLSLGLMGVAVAMRHGWHVTLHPEKNGLRRDLSVFLAGFGLSVVTGLFPASWQDVRIIVSVLLLNLYFFYLLKTIRASRDLVANGHGTEADDELYFARWFGENRWSASVQLLLALAVLVLGARMFVEGAESMSELLGIPALVISLLIVPVATELPEKVNSILWIRKRKDTLAFGNITGAMVFQGTIIPAVGMMLMPWHLDDAHAALSSILALTGAVYLGFCSQKKRLMPVSLLFNTGLYLIFIFYVVLA